MFPYFNIGDWAAPRGQKPDSLYPEILSSDTLLEIGFKEKV